MRRGGTIVSERGKGKTSSPERHGMWDQPSPERDERGGDARLREERGSHIRLRVTEKGGHAGRRQRGRGATLAGEGGSGEPRSPHREGMGMNIRLIQMKRGATLARNKGKARATLARERAKGGTHSPEKERRGGTHSRESDGWGSQSRVRPRKSGRRARLTEREGAPQSPERAERGPRSPEREGRGSNDRLRAREQVNTFA